MNSGCVGLYNRGLYRFRNDRYASWFLHRLVARRCVLYAVKPHGNRGFGSVFGVFLFDCTQVLIKLPVVEIVIADIAVNC